MGVFDGCWRCSDHGSGSGFKNLVGKGMCEGMDMKIDLGTIHDDIDGDWWLHARAADFGFLEKIKDRANHDVDIDDILIHKKILEGERFPTIRYHVVTASGTRPATNPEAKDVLARSLVKFVKARGTLPWACIFVKLFKNGAAQVDYAPTQWDKFALKVEPADHGISDVQAFFQHGSEPANPAATGANAQPGAAPSKPAPRPQGKGGKITSEPTIEAIAAGTGGAVSIFDAEVLSIEQRESHYQEEVTIFYIISLKGGQAAADTKKSTERKPFAEIRARFSDTIVEETKVAPGDRVTFNGRLKDDKYFGLLLQNVKKVAK